MDLLWKNDNYTIGYDSGWVIASNDLATTYFTNPASESDFPPSTGWVAASGTGTPVVDYGDSLWVADASFNRVTTAERDAQVPYAGAVVQQWAKDTDCVSKQVVTYESDKEFTPSEYIKTERWRTKYTEECGVAPDPVMDSGEFVTDNGAVVFN